MASGSSVSHWFPDQDPPLLYQSIGALLRRNVEAHPHAPAIKWPNADGGVDALSYAQLLERAEQLANWLLQRAARGDRLAVWSQNRIEIGVLFYASALAGTIMVALNPSWTDAEVVDALDLTDPILMFVGTDMRGQDLRRRAATCFEGVLHDIASTFDLAVEGRARVLPDLGPETPYVIQFTSGTTGRAKGALLSQGAAVCSAALTYPLAQLQVDDVWLVYTPFHHIGGSCSVPLAALSCGGSYVCLERFDVEQIVRLIEPTGATQMSGVPTMWFDLLRHPALPASTRIRTVTVGGASVPAAIGKDIEGRTGGRLAIAFAQSECPAICLSSDGDLAFRSETIGRPVPHAEVKIINPCSGAILPVGAVGEICVRGPMVMDGYWGDEEATRATIDHDGFLHTGDLGSMDASGACRMMGRQRDLVIRGGENVYPIEVEEALMLHPDVALAAVVGIPDERLGQEVGVVIQPKPGVAPEVIDLTAYLRSSLASYKVPKRWRFVDAFPMTASAKIRKVGLERLFD